MERNLFNSRASKFRLALIGLFSSLAIGNSPSSVSLPFMEHKEEKEEPQERKLPPAGPHAKPELVDSSKTPGTGMLPDPESDDANQAPTG